MTCYYEFVRPAVRKMMGAAKSAWHPAMKLQITEDVTSKGGRMRFHLGRFVHNDSGSFLEPVLSQSSADLGSAAQADGVFVIPIKTEKICAGEVVEFHPWGKF